jgi:acetolactate synthase I/II/III large subunit
MSTIIDDWSTAVQRLLTAARPALLVGPEAGSAAPLLVELAEWLGAPLATTPDALSLVDGERSCGVYSFGASAHAKRVFERADLVLAVSDLGEFTCRLGEAFVGHTLLQVAESACSLGRRREPELALLGPVPASVKRLRELVARRLSVSRAPWFDPLPKREGRARAVVAPGGGEAPPMLPEAAARAIEAALPEQVRVCLDVTSAALHCYQHWRLATTQRAFSSVEHSACMGEALLASLGVRLASGLPTLALVGDWGYSMAPAELHTAVELALDRYVVVVWANGGGALIGAGVAQQRLQVPEAAWRWQTPPRFAQVAAGYGAEALVVSDALSLEQAVAAGLRGPRPVLIEARIDPTAPVPAGDRFLTLGEAPENEGPAPPPTRSRVALRKARCEP